MSIRFLVADDQSMVRAGFRMLLSGERGIEVVAEASNGAEAVDKAARFRPTVVLGDRDPITLLEAADEDPQSYRDA